MKFLIDTDWIIHYLNGKQNSIEKLNGLRPDGLALSMISFCEIYEGIFGSREAQRHETGFKEFLTGLTVVELTEDVCKKFGELRNELRRKGELIADFDLLIASTALVNNLVLLTENVKHYQRIKGLQMKSS